MTHLLVASSKMKTGLFRTVVGLCVSSPPLLSTMFQRLSFWRAWIIFSSETLPYGSILNRKDPGIRKGSCGTTLIRERNSAGAREVTSIPSILIQLSWSQWIIASRLRIIEVLPLPERPQIAILSPFLVDSVILFNTGSAPGLKIEDY